MACKNGLYLAVDERKKFKESSCVVFFHFEISMRVCKLGTSSRRDAQAWLSFFPKHVPQVVGRIKSTREGLCHIDSSAKTVDFDLKLRRSLREIAEYPSSKRGDWCERLICSSIYYTRHLGY